MGTKVQYKSHLPGYCYMRDLNEDPDSGSRPVYREDMMLNRQYNSFLPRQATNGHSTYDKEVLRQTMLMHEETFKNQLAELHRLYRKQRNLMEELKRNEVHRYPVPADVSQTICYSSSSQRPSEDARNLWSVPEKPSCSRPSFSSTDDLRSPTKLVDSRSMHGQTTSSGNFKDCGLLDSNSKTNPQRMFDLQLPADQYMDHGEKEQTEEEKLSRLDNNINLSLGSDGNLKFPGDSSNSNMFLWNKKGLADLNHPIQDEEAASTASVSNFTGSVVCRNGSSVQDTLHQVSASFGLPKDSFQNTTRGMENGSHNNFLHLESTAGRQDLHSFHFENGQARSSLNVSQNFGAERYPTASIPIQAESRNTQLPLFLRDDQSKRGSWRESGISVAEMSKRSERFTYQNSSKSVLVPNMQTTYPAAHDVTGSGLLSTFSSWNKPTSSLFQSSITAQAPHYTSVPAQLSKISEMPIQKNGIIEGQWNLNSHSRSNSSFGSGIPNTNGILHRSQNELRASEGRLCSVEFDCLTRSIDNASTTSHLENHGTTKYFKSSDCMDVKSAKGLNLNIPIPNGFMEGMAFQEENLMVDGERKNKGSVEGLPWLKKKPVCVDRSTSGSEGVNQKGFCDSHGYSHESTPKVGIASKFFQNSSVAAVCDADDQTIHKRDNGKKILGFPIFDSAHICKDYTSHSSSSKLPNKPSEVESVPNGTLRAVTIDLSRDPCPELSSENVTAVNDLDKDISTVKHHFNLNASANEEESSYSIPTGKPRIELDLETPAVPDTPEVVEEEYQVDQCKISPTSSQVEPQDPPEEHAKIVAVAEAIIIISSSGFRSHSEDVSRCPSETSSNHLQWFADIASSHKDLEGKDEVISREKGSGHSGEAYSSDSDYFEMMTLNLTETKLDECLRKPWVREPPNEGEECASSLLPPRRRRGQAKRGRQRKDFQRDILPGLSSLSRHEVSEDIRVIGGLMNAIGHPWQTRVAKRNAAKNGWARGRRRTRNTTPVVEEPIVCSPPRQQQQANNGGLGLEERSLTGWGKTTRRPRRQRIPAGNISIPITQV